MKTRIDARFRAEAKRYALRFACEDCVYFTAEEDCAHGYPPAPRRGDLASEDDPSGERWGGARELTFCKEFELG